MAQEPTLFTPHDQTVMRLIELSLDTPDDAGTMQPRGRGIVTLAGPTQCGKSFLVKHFAQQAGLDLVTIMPGLNSPEDVGGWPIRDKAEGSHRIAFTNPAIIPHKYLQSDMRGKFLLFLDEIEKSSQDVMSTLLELLIDRRIRHTQIECAGIVCAMNEPRRSLHPALLARLLMVPYPGPDYDIWSRSALAAVKPYLGALKPVMTTTGLPPIASAPGAFHRISEWFCGDFWNNEVLRKLVLHGSLSETDAIAAEARFSDKPSMPGLDWAQQSDPTDIAAGLAYYLYSASADGLADLQKVLWQRAADDPTGEMAVVLDAFYKQRSGLGCLETRPDESKSDQLDRIDDAQRRLYKAFKKEQRKRALGGPIADPNGDADNA